MVASHFRFALLTVGILTSASGAPSQTRQSTDNATGNDFYSLCTSTDAFNRVRCVSLLEGFVSGNRIAYWEVGRRAKMNGDRLRSFCLPDEATTGQIRDVVVSFLRDVPQARHMPSAALIHTSLERAFPCPREKK
jgi:hypothetical protein